MTLDLLIDISTITHGLFNGLLAFVFLYQAWTGLTIRGGRKMDESRIPAIKRHRRLGPFLVVLGLMGYCFGLMLVYIDKGRVFQYPPHFVVGSILAVTLLVQYAVSRKIKGRDSSWRTPHFMIGLGILCLYGVQIIMGIALVL